MTFFLPTRAPLQEPSGRRQLQAPGCFSRTDVRRRDDFAAEPFLRFNDSGDSPGSPQVLYGIAEDDQLSVLFKIEHPSKNLG